MNESTELTQAEQELNTFSAKLKFGEKLEKPEPIKEQQIGGDTKRVKGILAELNKIEERRKKFIEEIGDHKSKNDVNTFESQFNDICRSALKNIAPKSMPIGSKMVKSSWGGQDFRIDFRIGAQGFLVRSGYRSSRRPESQSISRLMNNYANTKADMGWVFDQAIDALRKGKFRTAKRSIPKLKNMKKLICDNYDLLKATMASNVYSQEIDLDIEGSIVCEKQFNFHRASLCSSHSMYVKFERDIKAGGRSKYGGIVNEDKVEEHKVGIGNSTYKFSTTVAFAYVSDKFPELMKELGVAQAKQIKDIEDILARMRKVFAKDILKMRVTMGVNR
ncbi:hypothetical protein GOV11_00845 [Candidatus Woesearchaeota archaeon]|nr:hypothetical protein [Candidatus Woesearchaeota archaeon]